MKPEITYYDRKSFEGVDPFDLYERIQKGEVVVVKKFIETKVIDDLISKCEEFESSNEAGWSPLVNECPDYHRFNKEYEQSYVKGLFHMFLFHLWYPKNNEFFDIFRDTFELKRQILNKEDLSYVTKNIPSDGFVSRLVIHHYPTGGGYLSKHVDPINRFNPIQTLIQMSSKGINYKSGGLFVEKDGQKINLDDYWEKGDLLMFTQSIPHGVDPIDKGEEADWNIRSGRLMAIPLSLRSDYIKDTEESPRQVQ